jgi:two-component system, OmpR family, sensor histidine kinase MprB
MSFRQRLMLYTALAIAVTVAGTSLAVWVVAKHEIYSQLDQTLAVQAQGSSHDPFGGAGSHWTETIHADGDRTGQLAIPVTARALAVANGTSRHYYYVNTTIQKIRWRELVIPISGPGGAVISIYPLAPTAHALARIRLWILLVGGIGIALAAALAAVVATAALRPVRRLTTAAENVAATGDLSERVTVSGHDELGRLGARFNAMLEALEESVGRQRRLVADASHELRTPLTSTRTNIDLLREGRLPPEEAKHALDEASIELAALTTLVSDLVELARGEERKLRVEDVQLDDLVGGAVERARSRAPEATFVTSLSPTVVRADPILLERAVLNLLDNAVKYSPAGAPIEVTVREGEVIVADHGPGVAEEDAGRIFDRFYRSAAARSKPGAGLGLAIVREAARAHGGDATVESSASGARFRLTLPAAV